MHEKTEHGEHDEIAVNVSPVTLIENGMLQEQTASGF